MKVKRYQITMECVALALMVLTLEPTALAGGKEKILFDFHYGPKGQGPYFPKGNLVFDGTNFYGTAAGGNSGNGVVFQLTPPTEPGGSWTESRLYSFKGLNSHDGEGPGGLIVDRSGNVFGTTYSGGGGNCQFRGEVIGCGTVYELSPPKQEGGAWTETVLYRFHGSSDGGGPFASLVIDSGGNLYGTTLGGGKQLCVPGGCGIIFELSPPKKVGGAWTENILYKFKGGRDSQTPYGNLVRDGTGAVYGTTAGTGLDDCGNGLYDCGTVFKLIPPVAKGEIWRKQLLHHFNGPDGNFPMSGLSFDALGTTLYGTTLIGGSATCNCGVIFSLSSASDGRWSFAVLHRFSSGGNASGPEAGVILDKSGNLYGTTVGGGAYGFGSVFKLAPTGTQEGLMERGQSWFYTVLHSFRGSPDDGAFPSLGGSLALDGSGNLFGTTQEGGTDQNCQNASCGTAFEVKP